MHNALGENIKAGIINIKSAKINKIKGVVMNQVILEPGEIMFGLSTPADIEQMTEGANHLFIIPPPQEISAAVRLSSMDTDTAAYWRRLGFTR